MGDSVDSTARDGNEPASDFGFARVQLPPIPSMGLPAMRIAPLELDPAPATDLDGRAVGGRDEPAHEWASPLPAPVGPAPTGYVFQVVSPPPPPSPMAETPVAPAPTALASAPEPTTEPAPAAPANKAVATALLITALMLVWASRMAFSAALLSMSALLLAELARAASQSRTGTARPTAATLLMAGSVAIAGWSLLGAFGQMQPYAFVGGLFVLIAAIPTLIVLLVTQRMLRRRTDRAPGDDTLLATTRVRVIALAALTITGIQAHRTFTAKPDAIVAVVIAAGALWIALSVLRGTDRAAASSSR